MRLNNINLPTPDAARLAAFYRDVLGARVDDSHGGPNRIEIWFGDESTVCIVATQDAAYKKAETSACQGFELEVQNADAEYARVQALGIEVQEPPKNLPWGYRYFHIKDPDGNGIDLVQAL
jgi:predicted enzyme related to lactoylglutathione lyase